MRHLRSILGLFGFLVLVWCLHVIVPPQHNQFRAPDLTEPLGLATYAKLTRLKHNPSLCLEKLGEAGVEYVLLAADTDDSRCALGETLTLTRSLTPYNAAPLRMSCQQMAALYMWERQIARPLAEKTFGSPLRQIETYGTFSCRNIAGSNKRSEHSYANAIDISGFVLEDGRRIMVRDHWRASNDYGRFLKKVHRGACKLFSVTLGPDYDAAHADHFHFDMGSTESCK